MGVFVNTVKPLISCGAKFVSMMVLAVSFIVLENMVAFYEEIGKKDEAEKLAERARKIRSKNQ